MVALRGYHRQRQMQIRYAASHTQHMQKALEQMNVKLTEVVSDITGLTGRRIIAAIVAGERDPRCLAALRDPKCKNDTETIAKALEGTWRPEHLFALRQAYELYQLHHRQIAECDALIQAELARLPNRSGDKPFTAKPLLKSLENAFGRLAFHHQITKSADEPQTDNHFGKGHTRYSPDATAGGFEHDALRDRFPRRAPIWPVR